MWSWIWIPIVDVCSVWSNQQSNKPTNNWTNKQLKWITTNYVFNYIWYRFCFWFGWPYLLYSEFLFTTLARITSAALKWQSAKQLVVVSLIHVVKERNLNKSLSEYQEGLSIYILLLFLYLIFPWKTMYLAFQTLRQLNICTVHTYQRLVNEWLQFYNFLWKVTHQTEDKSMFYTYTFEKASAEYLINKKETPASWSRLLCSSKEFGLILV